MRFRQACGGALASAAVFMLAMAAGPVRADPYGEAKLAFHIFGSGSRGQPLRDSDLVEDADLRGCGDARNLNDDDDVWARAKFGCQIKSALGWGKDWIRRGEKDRLEFVLLFNGGLNTQSFTTGLARDRYETILRGRQYPIFMIWPTGGVSAYGESLIDVRSAEKLNRANPINWLTAVTQAASDVLGGVSALPKSMEDGVRYNVNFPKVPPVERAAAHWRVRGGVLNEKKNVSFSDDVDVDRTHLNPVTIALSTARPATMTLREIGLAAWSNMVRRTRTSIHHVDEFPEPGVPHPEDYTRDAIPKVDCDQALRNNGRSLRTCFPSGAGAFSRFFHWYLACVDPGLVPEGSAQCPLNLGAEDRAVLRNARFTLVGHSMGAIVINELLSSYPQMPYENLVFMAGADSVRSTRKTLAPLLVRNGGCTRFYNLMLHPKNDAEEAYVAGALPKGSLLEYIDHYLDPPKTIDDRTIGKWVNIMATKHMFSPAAQRSMLFQVYDRSPDSRYPAGHGKFNDEGVRFWAEDFWNPQSVAFPRTTVRGGCGGVFFRE